MDTSSAKRPYFMPTTAITPAVEKPPSAAPCGALYSTQVTDEDIEHSPLTAISTIERFREERRRDKQATLARVMQAALASLCAGFAVTLTQNYFWGPGGSAGPVQSELVALGMFLVTMGALLGTTVPLREFDADASMEKLMTSPGSRLQQCARCVVYLIVCMVSYYSLTYAPGGALSSSKLQRCLQALTAVVLIGYLLRSAVPPGHPCRMRHTTAASLSLVTVNLGSVGNYWSAMLRPVSAGAGAAALSSR